MRLGKQNLILTILLTLLSTAVFAAIDTQYSASVCGNQKYLFGCQTLASSDGSGEYVKTLGDSTVHLHLLFAPLKNTAYTAEIEPGQKYLFGCQILDAAGTESNTLKQSACECDSTVTLTLKYKAPSVKDITVSYAASIYAGETYLFGCEALTAAGPYSRTIARVNGGDSIINLTLSVLPVPSYDVTVAYAASIYEGETYLFGCDALTAAGPYSRTIARVGAGDSIINLTLSVLPKPGEDITVSYNASITEGETYLFGCEQLTAAGPYSRTIPRLVGGDSIINLTLAVAPAPSKDITVSYKASIFEGETYLFGCDALTAAGSYQKTLARAGVGDSIINLALTVLPKPGENITVSYAASIYAGETYLFGCEQLTAAGPYSRTIPRLVGGDSIINLTLAVAPVPAEDITVSYKASIFEGESYLFGCDALTAAGSYQKVLARAGVGDSIINLALTVLPKPGENVTVSYKASIFEGETYLFGCEALTAAGSYQKTLARAGVGDSIINLALTVLPKPGENVTVSYAAQINEGETYLFGCQELTAAGAYTNTLPRLVGGDSIINLTLSYAVEPVKDITVSYAAQINEGETYLFGCQELTAAGAYTNVLPRAEGGDSIINLTLSYAVEPQPVIKVQYSSSIEVEETYLFGCTAYTFLESGPQTLTETFVSADGLDSIVIVNLTVIGKGGAESVEVAYSAQINEGETYLFGCQELTVPGVYTNVLPRAEGGDSIINLTLSYAPAPVQDITVSYTASINAGETYLFGCQELTAAGSYTNTLPRAEGGDSIINLTLSVIEPEGDIVVSYISTIYTGQTYLFGCQELTDAGIYNNTLPRLGGEGDSVIWLDLRVVPEPVPSYGDTTAVACQSFVWYEHVCTLTGEYVHTFIGANVTGGDSIVTLHMFINTPEPDIVTEAGTVDNSYTWDVTGYTYTESSPAEGYKHIKYGQNGECDTTYVLHVVINHACSPVVVLAPDTTVCDEFYWVDADTTILASGMYQHVFAGVVAGGCDSIVVINVTVNNTVIDPEELAVDTCDSYYWADADTTITTSGTYKHAFAAANGCDSVVTMNVTINKSVVEPARDTVLCNIFNWVEADTAIITSGTYTHVFNTVHGCDSVVTLNVVVNAPQYEDLPAVKKYKNRLLVLNRDSINRLPGWANVLDSLSNAGEVKWYKMVGTAPDITKDEVVGDGYYYHNAELTSLVGTYYAAVLIAAGDGATCDHIGRTSLLVCEALTSAAPALMPTLARPGEDIKVINLDPDTETVIRVFTADGLLQKAYTVSGEDTFTLKAAYDNGFYLVELISDDMKHTLRYIVK